MTTLQRRNRQKRVNSVADGKLRIPWDEMGYVLVGSRYVPQISDGIASLKAFTDGWTQFRRPFNERRANWLAKHGEAGDKHEMANSVFNTAIDYVLHPKAVEAGSSDLDWLSAFNYEPKKLKRELILLESERVPLFTKNFVAPGQVRGNKLEFVTEIFLPSLAEAALRVEQADKTAADQNAFLKINTMVFLLRQAAGCGPFLAYNIALDCILYAPPFQHISLLDDDYVEVSDAARHALRIMEKYHDRDDLQAILDVVRADGFSAMQAWDVENMLREFKTHYVKRCVDNGTAKRAYRKR